MVKKYELYNEDCFSGMRRLIDERRKFDLILTDPPYEIGVNGRGAFKKGRAMGRGELDFVASGFDYATCFSLFLELQEITNIIVFCSNAQISKTMQFFEERGISATLLMWHKTNPVPFTNNGYLSDVEFIGFSHLKNLSMLKFLDLKLLGIFCFSHLKNLSMLKYNNNCRFAVQCFSHLKNLSMLK